MSARQRRCVTAGERIEVVERVGQVLERAAKQAHVVGMSQMGGQGGQGRLLLEIPAEVRAAHTPSKPLFLPAEEVLDGVVQPLAVDSQPLAVDSQPLAVDSQPLAVDSQPLAVDSQPLAVSPTTPSRGRSARSAQRRGSLRSAV